MKRGALLLIIAWSLLGGFNAIAAAMFFWSGAALNPSSDELTVSSFAVVFDRDSLKRQ